MGRLIDAEKLKEFYEPYKGLDVPCKEVCRRIDNQPTVDAVEVVRCKDCEYFMEDIFKRTVCNRTFDMFVMKTNDFCSYGKRKIGGDKE